VISPYFEEIKANLERAGQSVHAAKELAGKGYYDFAGSRAYYAAFYYPKNRAKISTGFLNCVA